MKFNKKKIKNFKIWVKIIIFLGVRTVNLKEIRKKLKINSNT